MAERQCRGAGTSEGRRVCHRSGKQCMACYARRVETL